MTDRSSVGWGMSSNVGYGGFFYSKLQWYYDGVILTAMQSEFPTATLIDFGAGSSPLGQKAVNTGMSKVIAVESNPSMVRSIERNIPKLIYPENMIVMQQDMYEEDLAKKISEIILMMDLEELP